MEPFHRTISLGVVRSSQLALDAQSGSKGRPNSGDKLGSSVGGDALGDSEPGDPPVDQCGGAAVGGGRLDRDRFRPARRPVQDGEEVRVAAGLLGKRPH